MTTCRRFSVLRKRFVLDVLGTGAVGGRMSDSFANHRRGGALRRAGRPRFDVLCLCFVEVVPGLDVLRTRFVLDVLRTP